ncbi:hypothetical protein DRJ25_03745 [Candidatus Woesearchaeota archaeon]|nr:MAG: hypothetical protein DRJ25_03745 [Candidatus Woesearchaeota archaeon]
MCYAPYVSFGTFIIELMLALFFLIKNPKDKLNRFIAAISFMLGFYQLNEFLICTTKLNLFTRMGIGTTAILPAMAISYALIMWRKRIKWYWNILIYLPAVFFIVVFALPISFTTSAICNLVFIQWPNAGLYSKFFGFYYTIYLLGAAILFYFSVANCKDKILKRLYYLGMLGMFIFTVPTFVFLQFLPSQGIQFPSILCEFALLLAIEFVFVIWYKEKHKLRF